MPPVRSGDHPHGDGQLGDLGIHCRHVAAGLAHPGGWALGSARPAGSACQVVVEMYPHGILFVGPLGVFFRHRKNSLPEKSSPRHKGSVPCYDTMATSLLAKDAIQTGSFSFCRNYFFDYSTRLLKNWQLLHQRGYAFDRGLRFPDLDFSSTFPGGVPCSFMEIGEDPCFIRIAALFVPASIGSLNWFPVNRGTGRKKRRFVPFSRAIKASSAAKAADRCPPTFGALSSRSCIT